MDQENKNRINIDDLPKPEEEISAEEQNNVTGGHSGGINAQFSDGSVRFVSPTIGNTVGGSLADNVSKP